MLVLKSQIACATTTTKISTILVCMILNGKVVELIVVDMGMVNRDEVLFLFFFNRSTQYSWLFLKKTKTFFVVSTKSILDKLIAFYEKNNIKTTLYV